MTKDSTLVVCIGSEFRSDDRVGLYLAEKLLYLANKLKKKRLKVEKIEIVDLGLLEKIKNAKKVIIIDAIKGNRPGRIHIFNPESFKQSSQVSTHFFNLFDILSLGKILYGSNFPNVKIYGIEVKNLEFGRSISKEVKKAADKLIKLLENNIT